VPAALELCIARLAAADEVDDFEAVVRLDLGLVPEGAGENIEIALNREAVTAHFQVVEERGHSEAVRDLAWIAVNFDHHGAGLAGDSFWRDLIVKRISSFQEPVLA
jgi:hypothetical protein